VDELFDQLLAALFATGATIVATPAILAISAAPTARTAAASGAPARFSVSSAI
jgi:hypothetical protein